MATQTDIPSELTNDDKALVFQILDTWLNSEILYALLHGIYTGILAVTLWNIFINKCWPIRRAVVVIIILLHALITISFGANWSYIHFGFIENRQNYWTVYLIFQSTNAATWVFSIAAAISTILADLYMIWCCWMVWGQRWLVVLLPIFSLVSAISMVSPTYTVHAHISRAIEVYYDKVNLASPLWNIFMMLYISLNLVTTLSCTLLIIYRIVTVTASIAKGVAPTLLVGRAAAGHTRPRDDSDESTLSSLHFQTPSEPSTTSSQHEESTIQSSVFAVDIEAQPECS
ncbi:hypothetical protein ARMGADRAFT_1028995 [Armillaria gallica]|uniref:Uncharacterized protein n=1 Tax=Armillaria gallica TaxID=47427 RepID=A0A2H3DUU6_ARMGA|nr:hypothetical protein ARMGADRAFT_1028995 [Armillaria gallica]